MKVGIVVLNYNDAKQTIAFVNTISKYKSINTICIVDNNSKDDYKELIPLENKKIKIIGLSKNAGYAAGNNTGLKYLYENDCDTFIIANPDILIEEHACNDFIAYIKAYPQYGIFGPTIQEQEKVNRGWKLMKIGYDIMDNFIYINRFFKKRNKYADIKYNTAISEVEVVSGCFFAITRKTIDTIGMLDEGTFLYYEENILATQAKQANIKTCVCNTVKIIHNHSVTIDKNINHYHKLRILKDSQYYYRSIEKHSKIAMWLLKKTGDVACWFARKRTDKKLLKTENSDRKKVTILSLHMQIGGIEKAICSMANMLIDSYDVEIINIYDLVDTIPFPLDKRVEVKYLSTNLRPNKKEIKQAIKTKNITQCIKEGYKAMYVLHTKRKLIKQAAKECTGDIIVSTTLVFNKYFSRYQKSKTLVAWEHCHPSRSKNYVKKVKRAVKKFDVFIPASKALYEFYYERLTGPKCIYVPLCIDEIPSEKAKLNTNHITVMGRLSKEKGYEDILKVVKELSLKREIHLDIIGDGDEWDALHTLTKELEIEPFVTFHGNTVGTKKENILLNTSVFITTSHYESFGLVLLEAMSYGIPCISFDSAKGSLEIIEDGKNGYLIKERSIQQMADKIDKLLTKTTKVMQNNAIKTAKRYSYKVVKEDWLHTFDKLSRGDIKKRVIFTSSAGGHYSELCELNELMDLYNSFLLTEDHEMMKEQKKINKARSWYLRPGTKEHLAKFLWNFPFNISKSFKVYIKVKPDVIIATGAHTTVPICYIAKLFGKKVIFIETFANITTKTLSGKLVYPIADLFLVQWPEMLGLYPNAKYKGGLK